MPSEPAEQRWSLTRRLATNFAVITSLLLAFMALLLVSGLMLVITSW